jgi:hypothetical protein
MGGKAAIYIQVGLLLRTIGLLSLLHKDKPTDGLHVFVPLFPSSKKYFSASTSTALCPYSVFVASYLIERAAIASPENNRKAGKPTPKARTHGHQAMKIHVDEAQQRCVGSGVPRRNWTFFKALVR